MELAIADSMGNVTKQVVPAPTALMISIVP